MFKIRRSYLKTILSPGVWQTHFVIMYNELILFEQVGHNLLKM
jgi:hypothetical protein